MRNLIFLVILSCSLTVLANQEHLFPLDPKYHGEHAMILMSKSSKVFAYHSPTYQKPTNVQILYELAVKDFNLVQLVRDNELVTIRPKPFNLQRLIRGEELVIKADVYLGDYRKDGDEVYTDMNLTFDKQLYLRELDGIPPASQLKVYDEVAYDRKNGRFFIHRLQQAPSYDHLIHIDVNASCLNRFKTSKLVPKRLELQYKFMNCGSMKPMYFETTAFSE